MLLSFTVLQFFIFSFPGFSTWWLADGFLSTLWVPITSPSDSWWRLEHEGHEKDTTGVFLFSKVFSDYQRTHDSHPNYLLSISAFLSKPSGYHTLINLQFNHLPTTNFHKFPFTSSVCLPMKGELRFVQAQISYIYKSDNSGLMLKWASLDLVFPQ